MTHNSYHKFSIAPMMDWTTKHYRYFSRLMTKRSLLYTEMITTGAILHGDRKRFLDYNREEHPIVIQLGGSNPNELTECAKIAEGCGYDEVNLNIGCPSERVRNNMIGACLMAHPELVAECISKMQNAVSIPVTVKNRIGIDEYDSPEFLHKFIDTIKAVGCNTFIIHSRKAILQGLSPKENREIPPLIYERVHNLKTLHPDLEIVINGGISDIESTLAHLRHVDGVMVGRQAYQRPWFLHEIDSEVFGENKNDITRLEVGYQLLAYIEAQYKEGVPIWRVIRHCLGLFHGEKGGKQFRRFLSENAVKRNAHPDTFRTALDRMSSYASAGKVE